MESNEKPTSLWKKEISFRRKPAERGPESAAVAAPPAREGAKPASKSVWKQEVSWRKKPHAAPATVQPEAAALPERRPEPEPAAEIGHTWLTKPLEQVSEPPEADLPAELAELMAAGTAETAPLPALELPLVAEADLPELLDLPELPAALAELVPDVAEAEPPVVSAAKVPFYKRELSFKRSPKQWDKKSESKPAAERKAKSGSKPPRAAKPKLRRVPVPKPALPGGKSPTKLVGLKIGASQIAAARIVNGIEPELLQIAREPLDAGIVVGGELRDPDALAAALKEFFSKHKLPKRGVRLGIANNRIGVRTFEVAGIDDPKQLANAIRFRAQEVLPIPIEDAVLDYQILSESTDANGVLTRRVLLVVAYRELVDRYVNACSRAGIEIVGVDLEAFALLRALAEPRTPVRGDERGALVAVSVGHDRSTFAVSDGRNCEFTRVLEWGGWALNVAIARVLDLSPSEAEPVKRALSFAGAEPLPEGFAESQLETAREAARKQLQSFARELVSSLQFYQNQPDSLGIGEIVLTGGTTHLPGFAAELERLIGVPVRIGDPLARVKVSQRIRESEQTGSYAIAIGLGIED